MAASDLAAAIERVQSVLRRRPEAGIQDDAPATARWSHDLRVVTAHASGAEVLTDMPRELGGSGDQVTPGWLMRAALASCAVTRIAMAAASAGIELRSLQAQVHSRSDARGLLGVAGADGRPVPAGPEQLRLAVRIGAPGVSAERLQALVRDCDACSPVSCAMQQAVPMALVVDVEPA